MAKIIDFANKVTTKARENVGDLLMVNDFSNTGSISNILNSKVNQKWRAGILLDRITRPGPKNVDSKRVPNQGQPVDWHKHVSDDQKANSNFYKYSGGIDPGANEIEKELRNRRALSEIVFSHSDGTEPHNYDRAFSREAAREPGNDIILYNMMVSPVQFLVLQTVPKEIEFQGESTWAVINSMGRNTPMYHFTGAETLIQMNVSWFCDDKSNPQEVISKCRLLEAWTKANGYISGPPVLKIQWGRSDLFTDSLFILTSATYKLSNWRADSKVWDRKSKSYKRPNGYVDPAMYPSTATQELIFRRVSGHNLTYEDIIPTKWLEKTRGFGKDNKKL